MKKRGIILLLILAFCLAFVSCKEASQDSSKESKSVYELAVEAGFEGTLEEWCEAIANVKDTSESKSECTCQDNISLAEAILIAQTHYFAVYYHNDYSGSMIDVAELLEEDLENWYINVAPKDVTDDGETLIYKGQSHTYTISKKTGEIIEIDASGE